MHVSYLAYLAMQQKNRRERRLAESKRKRG